MVFYELVVVLEVGLLGNQSEEEHGETVDGVEDREPVVARPLRTHHQEG